jgi:hypothetical protein
MSDNYVSTMMLRSSFRNGVPLPTTTTATVAVAVAAVVPPLPLPLPLPPSTPSNTRFLFEDSIISHDNADNDAPADDDDLSYYDLYESPCRTLIRASNDELDESIIMNNEENIISYNSNKMINSGAKLLFDEMEYCGTTFFGGCQYNNLMELITQINDDIDNDDEEDDDINAIPSYHSFVNWTVFFDYEIHYIDVSNNKRSQNNNGVNENNDGLIIINEQRADTTATSTSSRTKMKTSDMLRQPQRRRKDQEQQEQYQYTYHRGDPIPAVEYLETIVLEHLSEVVGLTRRDCDVGGGSSSSSSRNTGRYHHDFTDNELDRMMAISSDPVDVLDPDCGKCIVPVSSVINQQSDCIPVRGAIRIYLNTTGIIIGDGKDDDINSTLAALKLSIESGFKRLIRFGMQRDMYVSIVEEDDDDEEGNNDSRTNKKSEVIVKQVSFIGTRIVFDNSDDKDNGTLVAKEEEDNDDGERDNKETMKNKNGDTTTTTIKYDDGYNDYDGELSSLNLSDSTTISNNDTTNVTGLVLGSAGIVVFALLAAMLCSTPRKQNSNNSNTKEIENENNNEEIVYQHGQAGTTMMMNATTSSSGADVGRSCTASSTLSDVSVGKQQHVSTTITMYASMVEDDVDAEEEEMYNNVSEQEVILHDGDSTTTEDHERGKNREIFEDGSSSSSSLSRGGEESSIA